MRDLVLTLPVPPALIIFSRPEKIAEHCRSRIRMNLLLEMCLWTTEADEVLCHTCCEDLWPGLSNAFQPLPWECDALLSPVNNCFLLPENGWSKCVCMGLGRNSSNNVSVGCMGEQVSWHGPLSTCCSGSCRIRAALFMNIMCLNGCGMAAIRLGTRHCSCRALLILERHVTSGLLIIPPDSLFYLTSITCHASYIY